MPGSERNLASRTDLELVRLLQRGEERALDELMKRYRAPLHRFIYRHVLDEESARDLLQETFVRAYFAIGRFCPKAKFSTWLYTIAIRLCRDYARSKANRKRQVTGPLDEGAMRTAPELLDAGHDPAQLAASRETMAQLEAAIQSLPHDLKTALILFSLEGHSHRDCGELLGITVKAVETRVHRARRLLVRMIEKNV